MSDEARRQREICVDKAQTEIGNAFDQEALSASHPPLNGGGDVPR
jgi:hypothetical protein